MLAVQLALYCRADNNVVCFPGTRELAARCGWDRYADGGKERVLKALAELDREGETTRLKSRQFWAWYSVEGRPKLEFKRPTPRHGCRRFILLLWRFPSDRPDLSPYLEKTARNEGPSPPPEEFEGGAGATTKAAPAPPVEVAPAPLTMNGSKVEPLKGERAEETTTLTDCAREGAGGGPRSSSSRLTPGEEEAWEIPTPEEARSAEPVLAEPTALALGAIPDPIGRALAPTSALPASPPADPGALGAAPCPYRSSPDLPFASAVPDPSRALPEVPTADEGQGVFAREALIAKIKEIAPGPDNREVRRALRAACPALLETARSFGSPSPSDHVRMALAKAAANPSRRGTFGSLARGILGNWTREGWPAIRAPEPPAQPKSRADPQADKAAAAERLRASLEEQVARDERKTRWDALPDPDKDMIWAEVESDHPELATMPTRTRHNLPRLHCLARMDQVRSPAP